tara:strand:- start:154568 stop:155710 length:1143 start_codon:yes stop_codon:yes gene_type:complete
MWINTKRFTTVFCCLLTLLSVSLPAHATTRSQKIKTIDSKISNTQSSIQYSQAQRDKLSQQLRSTEVKIGQVSVAISQLNTQVRPLNRKLQQLLAQENRYHMKLRDQRAALASQLRTAYINHQENYTKLLLNQENINRVSRLMTYYQFYNHARVKLIKEVDSTLTQLEQVQQQIQASQTHLQHVLNQRISEKHDLTQIKRQREAVVKQLGREIRSKTQRLRALKADKQQLQHVVNKVAAQYVNIAGKPFYSLHGKLPWPIRGRLLRNFGTTTLSQRLPLQGVLIGNSLGHNIRAIATGKVVYADWLRGFGLLMIVDHGKGYMTLYAHCNALYKTVGNIVQPGEQIATVGNSGGLTSPALLFQIRRKGIPQNPRHWCKGRP